MHPLQQQVHAVGARARRLVLLHAVAWVVGVLLAAVLVAGGLDYLLRFQDRGVRIIVSLLAAAAVGWSVWRFLLPAWRYRPSDVDTARRIERHFPHLRDRLSSAVAFLNEPEDDPRAGSADLRRAVVAEIASQIEQVNLQQAIDPRTPRKAMATAFALVACVVAAAVGDPASTSLAARRLAMPWSNEAWPLWNQLAFENPPQRLAKGENFEVELIDKNGHLPDEVQIQYWFEGDDPSDVYTESMKLLGEKMLARRENVTRSFRYRAVGGDHHSMPWISLEVVEPPKVASLEILLHPPAYSAWPVEKSGTNIRALVGTLVELRATTEKPLRAARIVIDAEQDREIPLTITSGGYGFELRPDSQPSWAIESSGSWRLVLTDDTGLEGGHDVRHELQAIPDRPPVVSLDGDQAVTYVTARAIIPLQGVVKDDLAIRGIELRYLDSARSDEDHRVLSLFRGPDQPPRPTASGKTDGAGHTHRLETTWDLAQLSGLEPGVQLTYHVAASDYKPQEDKSDTRRVVIISDRELEDRISRRHSDILTRLAETLDKQRAVRSQTTSLEIQLDEAGGFTPRDLDHLQSAELNQRQIQRMLAGGSEGVERQIDDLLKEVNNNRLDSPDVQRRMSELLAEVRRLEQDHLPAVQGRLIDALKEAQAAAPRDAESESNDTPIPPNDAARQKLHEAGEHQDAIIASLEGMLGELSQWDNYRRVARDIHQLRRDQDDLAGRTHELRMQTLGKEEKDLSPQERASLKRLGRQQSEIASRFEQTQSRMRDMAAELEATDPLAAETLADALDAAERAALAGKMREAGRNLEANRLGQAAREQQETSQGLEELLNVLSNRRENELGRQVEQLRAAAQELQDQKQKLKELRKSLDRAAAQEDAAERQRQLERLVKEQQRLTESINRLARRLQRLQAQRASQSASQSAQHLDQAGEQAQQGDAEQALANAEQAERDLEQAEQELQQAIAQAEQDLFFEQLARLEQALAGMIKRQNSVVEETVRLDELRIQQGELSRGQRASVASLAAVERALSDEAGQFAEKIAKARAFEFTLRAAIREMLSTAGRLDRGETGDTTQQAARAALDRLERLAEALKTESARSSPQEKENSSEQESRTDTQQPPVDGITSLAELKLLQLMQEELNQRTAALEEARQQQGELTPDQELQLADLAEEQGRLAELLLSLGATEEAHPEDDPESLPDPTSEGALDADLEKSLEELLPDDLE